MRSSPTAVVSEVLTERRRLLESLQQPQPSVPTVPAETNASIPHGDLEETHSRMDAISGRWTLFASSRNGRPNEFVTSSSSSRNIYHCPFCEGNEKETPEAVMVVSGDADRNEASLDCAKGWGIRVIPNKYPAVDPVPPGCSAADGFGNGTRGGRFGTGFPLRATELSENLDSPLFRCRRTLGGHEVFIESPDHFATLADLDLSHVISLLKVYQARLNHWRNNPAIQYVSLFKNVGPAAGASLHHPHSQLIALSDLPTSVKTIADRMRLHHAHTGCCLQCDIVRAELKAKQRVVAVTDSLIAYCPFASHLPMLMRVTTRRHVERFEDLDEQELNELARLIRRSIGWVQTLYPEIAYNFLIHTCPPGVEGHGSYHWSFELFPRLTQTAGFEWSCDCTINPMLPEVAAEKLHSVAMQESPWRR